MINVFPEAEAPGIGIREHWGKGRGKEGGGILSLLRELCFWKVSLTQKSPATHLLCTLRATSSLAAPRQGGVNVQLLFASSNGLGEPWGLCSRVPHSKRRNQHRLCPVWLCWALSLRGDERRQGCHWLCLSCETQRHFSAARYKFACLSRSLTPCQMSNRSPHPDDPRTNPSGCITGCTSAAAWGHIYDPFGPCLLPLHRREVTAMLLWPQCCPLVLTSPICHAVKRARQWSPVSPQHPSLWTRTERPRYHKGKKKINLKKKIRFSQEQGPILFLQRELISLISDDLCLDSGSNSGEVSTLWWLYP